MTAANAALQDELQDRASKRKAVLSPGARFREASTIYLAKIEAKREDSTHALYEQWLKTVILPTLGELRLRECDVAQMDAFFSDLEQRGYAANTRRVLRAVVKGVLQQAVLHHAIASNPVPELEQIESPKGQAIARPRGLTLEERRRFLTWMDGGCVEKVCTCEDPKVCHMQRVARGADLPDLIRFGLGTGLRISEICGLRVRDLDLDGVPVVADDDIRLVQVVTMAGNMAWVRGKGLVRHSGKTAAALRVIPLPEFVATRLTARLHGDEDPNQPLFAAGGADGQPTFRWPSNVRRSVRAVRTEVGLDWMTPHTWRRTYATILDDEMGFTDRMKADLMGQARFLKDSYVSRGELHPDAAVVLDAALR
ncbi:MAG: tyrosine-type recombinase/integrase [Pseudonocardiaceae bacterium]|nr:tyrosine-type recombinase/integrase [Pseudonocardiaceae bacterium]